MSALRRLAALGLLGAAYAPLHRLLNPELAGPAAASTRDVAEGAWSVGLAGTLIVLVFAWVTVRMTGASAAKPWADRLHGLLRPSDAAYAVAVGLIAFALSTWVALSVHAGAPTTVDEMVQLAHARALASGQVGIPVEGDAAAYALQNGVITPEGWVSIYPPFHTLMLALGVLVGAPWLVGPVMTGIATTASTALAQRLLDPLTGRILGLLLVVSPFWLLLGGTHLSHTTAAAGLAVAGWAAVRARDARHIGWPLLTGFAIGAAVGARPWVGLAASAALVLVAWNPWASKGHGLGTKSGLTVLGGLPSALLLFGWNQSLFGSPLRLGYSEAFGPAHGLGLHIDPWGNRYGVVEALAYTGADLVQLGIRLLESPLPLLGLLGFALLRAPLVRGAGLFAAWAAVAVGANVPYWHHGVHLGPRMLYESTPAWLALFATIAAAALRADGTSTERRFTRAVIVVTLVGGAVLVPSALTSARAESMSPLPVPTGDASGTPATVFVHGAWASRVSARLVSAGMRRDSVETALRRNDLCAAHLFAREMDGGSRDALDFEPRPGSPAHLEARVLSPGNLGRFDPGRAPDPTCLREARSDRLGVLELEVVAWRADRGPAEPLYVRDLGPALNATVLAARPGPAWVLVDPTPDGEPRLLEYDEGMELLWGGAAGR